MKTSLIHRIIALGFVAITLGACGGGAAIGSACTKENDTSECESGALCAKTSTVSTVLQCQEICAVQADCPMNFNCNGTGAQKVCQPK